MRETSQMYQDLYLSRKLLFKSILLLGGEKMKNSVAHLLDSSSRLAKRQHVPGVGLRI